jgi:hypothetical protein
MMTVQQALTGEDEDVDLSSDNTPVLRIHLWRADAVSTVLEVDSKLHITKAEPLSGVMFGVSHKMLQRKTLTRWAASGGGPAWGHGMTLQCSVQCMTCCSMHQPTVSTSW